MSDDSIPCGEDTENLLYIYRGFSLGDFLAGDGDELALHNSSSTVYSEVSTNPDGSEEKLLKDKKKLSHPSLMLKVKAFTPTWSYGINPQVGLINLTTDSRKLIFCASAQYPIVYDYCTKAMTHLEGHQTFINSITADGSGSWFASADNDKDGCIIVWDSKDLKPVFTRFKIYPDSGVLLMEMSPCARYIVTIGMQSEEYHQIDLWLWTLGEENPDGTCMIRNVYGRPVKICFNPDVPEHIMLVFTKQIFFLVWNSAKKSFSPTTVPQLTHKKKLGAFTSGTYVQECREAYACSTTGYILVFRSSLYPKPFRKERLKNTKVFINGIKVSNASLECLSTTNGLVVTGDSRGYILFFDKKIRIMYWFRNFSLGPITSISFSNTSPNFEIKNSKVLVKEWNFQADYVLPDCEYQDVAEEIDRIVEINAPFDATLNNDNFFVNDFFVSTKECNVYAVNFLYNICTPLFQVVDAKVTAIDSSDEKPHIVIGFENGKLALINFETKEQISSYMLPKTEEAYFGKQVTCVKYSTESLHLACGRSNGELWILEPITLKPKRSKPFKCSKNCIVRIAFSYCSTQFAYFDTYRTVGLFNYNLEQHCWVFKGKIRSHQEEITDLRFFYFIDRDESNLYSIGRDRHLVEYNNLQIKEGTADVLEILKRERIEQSAIPLNFTYYIKHYQGKPLLYILLADDKHKLKFLLGTTKVMRSVALGPAYGCYYEAPITKMRILPQSNFKYMVFMSKRHLGLHILPPDGNPYKFTGYLAHPTEIADFVLSYDGKYAFTFGVEDTSVLQLKIETRAAQLCHLIGGIELEPYYCLLEGGRSGWLFQEIQDLFYYMQILHQESITSSKRVSDNMSLTEIPDLVRACGFYPSDFELETMMIDIRYRQFDETGNVRDEITFVEFVKLFINHRPVYGYSFDSIKDKFNFLCDMAEYPEMGRVHRNDFVYCLQNFGEASPNFFQNLKTLLRVCTIGEANFDFLPTDIDTTYFLFEILGLDPERTEHQDYQKYVEEEDED